MKSSLKEYMSKKDAAALGKLPTSHLNCKDKTGVFRPGKTARDKARNSKT